MGGENSLSLNCIFIFVSEAPQKMLTYLLPQNLAGDSVKPYRANYEALE